MDTHTLTLCEHLAMLIALSEKDVTVEPGDDECQGVKRGSWIQSVAFESVKSPEGILNASNEQLDNFTKFLTMLSYHVSFNKEVRALGDLPYDQFRIAYSALRYLSLGQRQVEASGGEIHEPAVWLNVLKHRSSLGEVRILGNCDASRF